MKRILGLCAVLMFTAGCQTTSQTVKNYPVGSTVSGIIIQEEKRIPLPSGS